MFIYIIKFIHLLIALGLLGSTLYCVYLISSNTLTKITRLNKIILFMSPFALLTGTLLIYPSNYTFHTHWIQAAYIFFILFCIGMICLIFFKEKLTSPWQWRITYLLLIIILLFITHDAVTKTTFIF